MITCSYSLSQSVLKNLPIDKYEENYRFIVNNVEYKTNRIVADFLSPTIKNNHYNDSSNNEFIINTSNFNNNENNNNETTSNDYFNEFLEFARFETHVHSTLVPLPTIQLSIQNCADNTIAYTDITQATIRYTTTNQFL